MRILFYDLKNALMVFPRNINFLAPIAIMGRSSV